VFVVDQPGSGRAFLFNELTKLFNAKPKERRHSPRKKVRFNLQWVKGPAEYVPGKVTEMSLSGLLFATKIPPTEKQFDVILDIGTRKVRLRLSAVRSGQIPSGGEMWHVFGCSYTGVAADDYDAIARVLAGQGELTNKAAQELASMDKTDDAYRMLPMKVQQRVLDALVRAGRLEMPQPNQQPLLRMSSLGSQAGKHRVAVHSRIPGGPQAFDSVLQIDEAGLVKIES
jgi:hypothetical protein